MPIELHSSVGTGAGSIMDSNGKSIPIISLHFAIHPGILEQMENGEEEFDPTDESKWKNYALSIRAARELIERLNEAVNMTIENLGNKK